MPNPIESELTKLEVEADARKVAFERAPYTLSVSTSTETAVTTANTVTFNGEAWSSPSYYYCAKEVTYTTYSGANTIAKIATDQENARIRRVPYAGGAKWIVGFTAYDEIPQVTITVHATVPGELEVKDL